MAHSVLETSAHAHTDNKTPKNRMVFWGFIVIIVLCFSFFWYTNKRAIKTIPTVVPVQVLHTSLNEQHPETLESLQSNLVNIPIPDFSESL